jgi:hypothetical protein
LGGIIVTGFHQHLWNQELLDRLGEKWETSHGRDMMERKQKDWAKSKLID